MSWTIKLANNSRKEYGLQRHTGESIKVTVPKEHQHEVTSKAYVQAVQDGHEMGLAKPIKFQIAASLTVILYNTLSLAFPTYTHYFCGMILVTEAVTVFKLWKRTR